MKLSQKGHIFEFGFKVGIAEELSSRNHAFKDSWEDRLNHILANAEKSREAEEKLGYINRVDYVFLSYLFNIRYANNLPLL